MRVCHLGVYARSRPGRLRLAVTVHVVLYLAVVALTMFRFGGIRSPAGFVLPPIVLLAGVAWSGRAALPPAVAPAVLSPAPLLLLPGAPFAPPPPPLPPPAPPV